LSLIADHISTKYKDREANLFSVAEIIAQTAICRAGNYMVYFPSYAYMKAVYSVFTERYQTLGFRTLMQDSRMDEIARESFLLEFDASSTGTLIGFCVMGGIFSEGIDLKGDRLIGTVIVGVGLPQINLAQDIIRSYYDELNGCGFSYAYQYPGMNKVLQAGGRVIRGESDRGVVVLVDERFTSSAYQPLFPSHWNGYKRVRSARQ
jgi:Rad3-related DNA helicase